MMSLKRQFIESFVQGLGRTSAAVVVVGSLTAFYFLTTSRRVETRGTQVESENDSPSFIMLKDEGEEVQSNFQKLFDIAMK
jgi:hypothetical protein